MNRAIRCAVLAVASLASAALAAPASAQVYVNLAPPAPIVETRPAIPGPGYAWRRGYWAWNGNRYVWSHGLWARPPHAGQAWIAGRWVQGSRGRWHWIPGHWR